MQSIWTGAIGFGLVHIPVRLYAATEEHGVTLHQVHTGACGGRIRMERTCEKCGRTVDFADVARGYTDPAGRTAVLTDADLEQLPLPSTKLVDVLAFVDEAVIDPLTLGRAYYLGAETAAAKPYVLLREALATSGKAAVTKVALRRRESLALLRAHGKELSLQTMYWPDEIRPAAGLAPDSSVTVRPQELTMATRLIDTLSEGFDLPSVHDDYQQALDQLVRARLEGAPPPSVNEPAQAPGGIADLVAALQASIDAHSDTGPASTPPPRPRTSRARATGGTAATKKEASRTTAASRCGAAKKTASGRSGKRA